MRQKVNEFGKRPRSSEEGDVASRRTVPPAGRGLHKFAPTSPRSDLDAVQDRYQKFVHSALALRGAIAFQDMSENPSFSGVYANERARCSNEFQNALSTVVADIPFLDNGQQRCVVEMGCSTEKGGDAGKSVNLLCKQIDQFAVAPRSTLLLNGIRLYPHIQPDARAELLGHLGDAIDRGYCAEAHLYALNTTQLGQPPETASPLSILAEKLEPTTNQPDRLTNLTTELLQKVLLHAIDPDLRKEKWEGLENVVGTVDAIASTSKRLRANAKKLEFVEFSKSSKEALSEASERYGAFMEATEKLFAMERNEGFSPDDPAYRPLRKSACDTSVGVLRVIKLLSEEDQTEMVSRFCKITHPQYLPYLMVAASERSDDFYPKPRSDLFASIIHLLPEMSRSQNWQNVAHDRLAKAESAGQLERRHYNALQLADFQMPGIMNDIEVRAKRGAQRVSNFSSSSAEPENPALVPALRADPESMTKIVAARQKLLLKLDDRHFSR